MAIKYLSKTQQVYKQESKQHSRTSPRQTGTAEAGNSEENAEGSEDMRRREQPGKEQGHAADCRCVWEEGQSRRSRHWRGDHRRLEERG